MFAVSVVGLWLGGLSRGRRVAAGAIVARHERAAVLARLRAHGSVNRLAWMTTWPENRWFQGSSAAGYQAYRTHAGVDIGLCDPVAVGRDDRATVLREFADQAVRRGRVPCAFAVTSATAQAAEAMGWRALPVGHEAVVSLPGLQFRGRAWQDVRTALNSASRQGIRVVLGRLGDQPEALQEQAAELSARWLGGRRLPELGFTLGGLDEAYDEDVRVAIAVDGHDRLHGFTSWLPAHRPADGKVTGWTLDVMRRRTDEEGFRGVMELLIASSLMAFRDEGCEWASLSVSPLSPATSQATTRPVPSAVDVVLARACERLEPLYGFRTLSAFKAKFQPRLEPLYLVYPGDSSLPRIAVALTRAYLPEVRLRDLAVLRQSQSAKYRRAKVVSTAAASSA